MAWVLRALVASGRREAGRRAYETAIEEGLEGPTEYGAPFFGPRQLLRIFHQPAKNPATMAKRPGGGLPASAWALVTRIVVCRACRARVAMADMSSGRLVMASRWPVRLAQSNEDVPPIIEERVQLRGQAAARQIVRREAAPSPLVLHFIENVLVVAAIAIGLAESGRVQIESRDKNLIFPNLPIWPHFRERQSQLAARRRASA